MITKGLCCLWQAAPITIGTLAQQLVSINTLIVMSGMKVLTKMILALVMVWSLSSCSGGFVSQNGIFENGHKELKESLDGSWRIVKTDGGLIGEELYEFYKDAKDVSLKVNGVEREIERFDSSDGQSFTFEYQNGEAQRVFVVGQFKSSAKRVLTLLEEPMNVGKEGRLASLTLERRTKQTETVVAQSGN